MTAQLGILLLIAVMTALFIQGRYRYDLIALGGLMVVAVTGLLPPKEVFSGLSHPVILTVAAVLILSRGLQESGMVDMVAERMSRLGWSPHIQIGLLIVLIAFLSAFVNNIGALSLLLPVGIRISQRDGLPSSKFLMALSFASILGGLFCIISTPVNLLISGIRQTHLGEGFEFFDFTPVGGTVMILGLVYLVFTRKWLLPLYAEAAGEGGVLALDGYTTELRVGDEAVIVGKSLSDIEALQDFNVVVMSVGRPGRIERHPRGVTELKAGDRLIVECDPTNLTSFMDRTGTHLVTPDEPLEVLGQDEEWGVFEAVVPPASELVGKTAQQVDLRYEHGLNLVGIARKGARIRTRLSRTRLKAGDILLVQTTPSTFRQAAVDLGLLKLAAREILGRRGGRSLWLGLVIFLLSILLAVFNILPVEQAFIIGALAMVSTGVLAAQRAYEAIDLPMLVLLACMLPLGHALETSGAAVAIAQELMTAGAYLPPRGTLALFICITTLLANLMNNKAATALMGPIALSLAKELGWSPDILLMGVAVGAEFVFLSPIGHQCNLLILGPGSYRFADFLKFGTPLVLLCLIASVILLPIVWPYQG